jgi:hypothetical protein
MFTSNGLGLSNFIGVMNWDMINAATMDINIIA